MGKELEAFSKEKQALDELYDVAGNIQNLKEDYIILKTVLNRLESIDNSNPSEALECLERIKDYLSNVYDYKEIIEEVKKDIDTIKQALLKAQEPKHYLKWEDLEFKEEEQIMKVLLNGNKYTLDYYSDGYDDYIDFLTDNEQDRIAIYEGGYPHDKQFFNDLHLERVEE